jgi:hypothetical protein
MQKRIFICIAVCFLLNACCTTGTRTDGQILEYQKQIDRLEEELRNRDRAIDNAVRELEAITTRSRDMEADIDTIIREFDEYQRAVERLLQDYREARSGKQSAD